MLKLYKNYIIAFIAVGILCLILILSGCGDVTTNTQPTPESDSRWKAAQWIQTTDPATGIQFNCYVIERWNDRAGGPSMWCYQP